MNKQKTFSSLGILGSCILLITALGELNLKKESDEMELIRASDNPIRENPLPGDPI